MGLYMRLDVQLDNREAPAGGGRTVGVASGADFAAGFNVAFDVAFGVGFGVVFGGAFD